MTQPNLTRGDELTSAQLRELSNTCAHFGKEITNTKMCLAADALKAFAALKDRAPAVQPVAYLCGGTRFKLSAGKHYAEFLSFPRELAGQWVALVDATDNRHITAILPDVAGEPKHGWWSFLRSVLDQGRSIEMDNQAGKYPSYEQLSARLDEAARERADELLKEGKQ